MGGSFRAPWRPLASALGMLLALREQEDATLARQLGVSVQAVQSQRTRCRRVALFDDWRFGTRWER